VEDVFKTFYGHLVCFMPGQLVHFTDIWYILWSFGIFKIPHWYVLPRKIWQPWPLPRLFFQHPNSNFHAMMLHVGGTKMIFYNFYAQWGGRVGNWPTIR
jgi:hypothetical protein